MGPKRILSADSGNAPALTLITDTSRFSGPHFFNTVDIALKNGLEAILVREKKLTSARLLALASQLRDITIKHKARLIIHSQADIALAVDADGVHVASTDIENIPAIRQWLADPAKTVSASCHNSEELKRAEASGADFAFLSPLFPTASHPGEPHLGLDQFNTLILKTHLPIIALGGITKNNCSTLKGRGLAVIGAILGSDNPDLATRQLSAAAREDRA